MPDIKGPIRVDTRDGSHLSTPNGHTAVAIPRVWGVHFRFHQIFFPLVPPTPAHPQRCISVVVPCFSEGRHPSHERLSTTLSRPDLDFTNSFTSTMVVRPNFAILRESWRRARFAFASYRFSAEFPGIRFAVTAGVDFTSGDAVVLIDADLQDPPEADPRRWCACGCRQLSRWCTAHVNHAPANRHFKLLTAKCTSTASSTAFPDVDIIIPLDSGRLSV